MKDIFQDIVSHTHNLGFLNIVKISSDDELTKIESMADDKSVIMLAEANAPVPEMKGIFGMPQLNKLKYLLDCAEYKENAKIELVHATRNNENVPVGIHFENSGGDFKNDYRFMNTEIINTKLQSVKFKVPKWEVELEPSLPSIQRFSLQAGANTEHTTFIARTEGTDLKFIFGDASTHGGEFVFAQNVSGKLDKGWTWPVAPILSILKIADVNNTKVNFSNEVGAMMITLDSGIATYKYIVPAQA
jgi:hypothetical protein